MSWLAEDDPRSAAPGRLGPRTITTDAGGNFLLLNPPVGPDQLLLIDGGPASSPGRSYPLIPYKVTIVAGQANTLGFVPRLHLQKTTGLVDVSNAAVERVVADPAVPGFEMRIPAGVTITGWDGQPNAQVSIRPVPVDRSPLPPPPPGSPPRSSTWTTSASPAAAPPPSRSRSPSRTTSASCPGPRPGCGSSTRG